MALRRNTLSFRSIKGQSHHSAGTRDISLERERFDTATRCAHNVVAPRLVCSAGLGRHYVAFERAPGGAAGPSSHLGCAPLNGPSAALAMRATWPTLAVGSDNCRRVRQTRRKHLEEFPDRSGVAAGQSQQGKEHFPGHGRQVVKEQGVQAVSAEGAARPVGT